MNVADSKHPREPSTLTYIENSICGITRITMNNTASQMGSVMEGSSSRMTSHIMHRKQFGLEICGSLDQLH
jgi:hypothetical protein